MKKLGIASGLFLIALSSACSHVSKSRTAFGTITSRGSDLREITADSTDAFYRGAFETCRTMTSVGFQLVQAPVQIKAVDNWGFTGLVKCTGPIDPALAQRYAERERVGDHFGYTKGPKVDRQYFEVMRGKPVVAE